jgi:hypothetical protein
MEVSPPSCSQAAEVVALPNRRVSRPALPFQMTVGWVAYLYTAVFFGIIVPTRTAPGEGEEEAISVLDRKLTSIFLIIICLMFFMITRFLYIPKSEV